MHVYLILVLFVWINDVNLKITIEIINGNTLHICLHNFDCDILFDLVTFYARAQ